MRGRLTVPMLLAAVTLAGCAGGRQDMARLRSQVTLLDQRIAQLERAQQADAWSAAPVSEPLAPTSAAAPAEPTPKASEPSSAKPYLKPTTRQIQQALKNAGFYQSAVDGKIGPVTRDAIKEFQRVHGLTDDGVVGRRTWATLSTYAESASSDGEVSAGEPFNK